jgi:hypothetical protein
MAIGVQVTFDAGDPHRVAEFWAQALGYQVEDHTEIVDGLVASGRLPAEAVVTLGERRGFRDVAASRDPDGLGPRLFFQRVPEPKTVKNRVHLDLHVGPERRDAEVERILALGATKLYVTTGQGAPCVTLADPEGNELCVE